MHSVTERQGRMEMQTVEARGRSAQGRGVLDGAFALLAALEATGEVGLTRVASASGLPKATAHRLLEQLITLGAVERHAGNYRIGPRIFRLGQAWQPMPGLRAAARLPARRLAALTRAGIAVTVPYEGQVLVVAAMQGAPEELVPLRSGMTFPLMSAAGKAIAAADPSLGVPGGYTIAAWRRAAALINQRGVATENGEVVPGVCCAAATIRSPSGQVAAISALVEADRPVETLAEALRRAAKAISANLAAGPARMAVAVP